MRKWRLCVGKNRMVIFGIMLGGVILLMPIFAQYVWLPFTSGVMTTGSMTPAINVGDMFLVDRTVSFSDVVVGDIIVFSGGFQPISHRVLAHHGFEIATKGDANQFTDAPVTESMYVGKVVGVVPTHMLGPYLGYFMAVVISFSGLLFVGALVVFIRSVRRKVV